MNVRTIQHPGVESREIDLSEYFAGPVAVNTNNAYVMGFTDRGPIYDYSWITSEAEFVAIYGTPSNEAERYLYYAMKSILDNGGNAIVARMPYDNKQCKCYKGTTLTYGVNKGSVGDYIGTEVYSNALIDLEEASKFIGTVKDTGLTEKIFPRFSTVNIAYQIPKGYLLWQFLAAESANFIDVELLSKASTTSKIKLLKTTEAADFVSGTCFLKRQFSKANSFDKNTFMDNLNKLFTYDEFTALYNGFREQYNVYTLYQDTLSAFTFDIVLFQSAVSGDAAKVNGIMFNKNYPDQTKYALLSSYEAGINKIFKATTPGFVDDIDCWYGENSYTWTNNEAGYKYGVEVTENPKVTNGLNTCHLTINDILVALNPQFDDYINFGSTTEPDLFFRGEKQNYMSIKCDKEKFEKELQDGIVSGLINPFNTNKAYSKRFTINGKVPSLLGVTSEAIQSIYDNIAHSASAETKSILSTEISTFYATGGDVLFSSLFINDVYQIGLTDIARIYNNPSLYNFTDEAIASIDANLLKQEEVGYKKMAALVSNDVLLSNYQYDSLVTTQNFEAEPDGDGHSVYANLGCSKINTANFIIIDKLKTIAGGPQNNEGYFVTVIDPFDALKMQRLLVNPMPDQDNVFETTDIRYWGMDANLAWGKQFDNANNTLDTLKRVKSADGLWIGEPGKGNKINIMDSWSVPLTGNYKNESVSKALMKAFPQIPLVTNQMTGETSIDKTYSSHIIVAVCRTGVNPSDGKIAVNIVETFFGSLFDEYDDITGETTYIGNLINEKSNYIEFYKNMYIQPGFGSKESKAPYNKTTVNQMFLKGSAALNAAANLVGVNVELYDVNEEFIPGDTEFMFKSKSDFETYFNEHSQQGTLYPIKAGTYYFKPNNAKNPGDIGYDPTVDSYILTCEVIFKDTVPTKGPIQQWKQDYGAFEYALKQHNIYAFNKTTVVLYNLYQNALFTSFAKKECEKKIANTTGIYSPVYGVSKKVASNFVQDMDFCIKFIQNCDEIPIYFVADAGMSTIAQFCDNLNWDSKTKMWITQNFDPDNDPDIEDHAITSKSDVETWWSVVNKLDYIASSIRKDCMTIIDAPRMMTIDGQAPKMRPSAWENDFDELIGKKLRFISGMNSSYSAGYLTWFRTYDKFTNKAFWLPPTCKVIGNLVYLNTINLPWLAPAGTTYGVINDVHAISLNPCASEEDQIYLKNWNYCKQYPQEGFVIEGQKTMLTKNSAFNRINVRTLFLDIERYVNNVARNYRYKVNNQFTREQFTNTIKAKLDDYVTRGGLTDFLIKCDETLNTPEVIDNNELRMAIYLKPGRLIEFVLVDYVCCKTGANFEEITY